MITFFSFLIANIIVSWIESLVFTGDIPKKRNNPLVTGEFKIEPIANKKWKTFFIFFICNWVIALILILIHE